MGSRGVHVAGCLHVGDGAAAGALGGGRVVLLENDLGTVLGDLVEERHRVVPDVDRLDLESIVDLGNKSALDLEETLVGLDTALLALAERCQHTFISRVESNF